MLEALKNECLFKYTDVNKNALDTILNNTLWHANVDTLNDPFEFFFKFIKQLPLDSNKFVQLMEESNYWVKPEYIKQERDAAIQLILSGNEILIRKHILKKASNAESDLFQLMQTLCVCSVSRKVDDPLMWSHYSNGMRGICIAYDNKLLNNAALNFESVRYEPSPPEINFFEWYKTERKDFTPMGKFLLTKQTNWKYEVEWRSIEFSKQQNSKGFLAPLKNNTIKAIIYGSKIKNLELEQLKIVCKQKSIPLLKATADRENYRIVIS